MFYGRVEELEFLEKEFEKQRSSFVVLYGRRRVGKTTLIKEFIKDKDAVYFLASEEIENENKKILIEKIAKFTKQEYLKKATFSKWDDIFEVFVKYKENQKKIIVIDEFQYLIFANSAFSSMFQRIWDEKLKDEKVMVIICGSYMGMMLKETLSYSSPLYGRRTGQIKLKGLKFRDVNKFYKTKDIEKLINFYSVTGGVPKYIEIMNENENLMESIKENILYKGSFLYDEPVFLMEKEVNEVGSYFSILKAIAKGNHKLSDIACVLEISSQKIMPYLKVLIDMGVVEKRLPITEEYPEKSRKGLYYIKDNFISFWFRFVFENKGELEIGNMDYVVNEIKSKIIKNHASYIYEDIAREILWEENSQDILPFRFLKLGSYWEKNIEIDIVGMNKEKLLVGECKYTDQKIDTDLFYDLKRKVENVKKLNDYKYKSYVFFSINGFTKEIKVLAKKRGDILLYEGIVNCDVTYK